MPKKGKASTFVILSAARNPVGRADVLFRHATRAEGTPPTEEWILGPAQNDQAELFLRPFVFFVANPS